MSLIGAHRRQEALCEFKANLVKKGSSRTARAVTQRNPVSINKTKGRKGERERVENALLVVLQTFYTDIFATEAPSFLITITCIKLT